MCSTTRMDASGRRSASITTETIRNDFADAGCGRATTSATTTTRNDHPRRTTPHYATGGLRPRATGGLRPGATRPRSGWCQIGASCTNESWDDLHHPHAAHAAHAAAGHGGGGLLLLRLVGHEDLSREQEPRDGRRVLQRRARDLGRVGDA